MPSNLALLASEATYKIIELGPNREDAENEFFRDVVDSGIVAIDTETTGFYWSQGARPFMATFCANTQRAYFIYDDNEYATYLFAALADLADVAFLFWNAKFDLHMTREGYNFILPPTARIEDGMLAQRLLDNLGSAKLKVASQAYVAQYGIDADEKEKTVKMWLSEATKTERIGGKLVKTYEPNYSHVPPALMVPYACLDVVLTLHAWQQQEPRVVGGMRDVYEEELRTLRTIIDMERVGWPVNRKRLTAHIATARDETARAIAEFEILAPGVNPASRPQLATFLYETLGNPIKHRTDGQSPAVHSVAIRDLDTHDVRDVLIRVAKWTTGLAKFEEIERFIGQDGRVHTNYGQAVARTSRMSSSEPNMQNAVTPRFDDEDALLGWSAARDVFEAEYGRSFLFVDFSAIEMRIFSHYAQDPMLLDIFREGRDSHRVIAGAMYGRAPEDVTKQQRSFGKRVAFCVPVKDSYALTNEGWVAPHALDPERHSLLGYVDGELRWTALKAVNFFSDIPVYKYKNQRFETVCTNDHSWVTQRLCLKSPHEPYVWQPVSMRPILGLSSRDRMIVAAPKRTASILNISREEAALLAWSFVDGTRTPKTFVIKQKNPRFIRQIDRLIAQLPHSKRTLASDVHTWTLDANYWADLETRSGLHDARNLEKFVALLDAKQLRYFAIAGYCAGGYATRARLQNLFRTENPTTLQAFELAFALCGLHVREKFGQLLLSKPYVTAQCLEEISQGPTDVWCPTTECGSWVMRQNGRIMLTGNTKLYGGGVNRIEDSIRNGVGADEGMTQPEVVEALAAFGKKPSGGVSVYRELATNLIQAFAKAVPSAESFISGATTRARMRRFKEGKGYVTNLFGRKTSIIPGKEYIAVNALIQSSAADLFKTALNRVAEVLVPFDADILSVIHDEIIFDVADAEIPLIVPLIREAMTAWPNISVPITVEFSVAPHGTTWAYKTEYDG